MATECIYRKFTDTEPGFWVYRMWAGERCLYAGMVGNLGPRTVQARLGEHAQKQPWWPEVTYIDMTECDNRRHAFAEECRQVETLEPVHNGRRYPDMLARRQREDARQASCSILVDYYTLMRADY